MAGKNNTTYPHDSEIDLTVWKYARHCMCGGTLKVYYSNSAKGAELKVMPRSNMFAVKQNSKIILRGEIGNMKTLLASI